MINIDPVNGSFQIQTGVAAGVSAHYVFAGNSLHMLDNEGRLIAYRQVAT